MEITLPSGLNVDFGDASQEQVQDALEAMREQDPSLFEESVAEPQSISELIALEESERAQGPAKAGTTGVEQDTDYKTGVQSSALRFAFSGGENPREKRLRLLSKGIPEEGILQDAQGEFILDLTKIPEDIKNRYGLKAKDGLTKLAVDEEGLSTADIIDFGAEAGTPLLLGTAAALATTGVGIPVAMLAVGAASALGYVADEALEYAQGVRDQTFKEDAKNVAFEFLVGGIGDASGRGLSKLFGRLAKGPSNAEANVLRESSRDILAGEVDAATGQLVTGTTTLRAANSAPLLGRAQAFYEGVFPNAKAATNNARYMQVAYQNLMREGGIPEAQVAKTSEEFLDALKKDIKKMYSTPDELVVEANKVLKNTVEKEINGLISMFADTSYEGGEAALKGVKIAKAAFDESADGLYTTASKLLGDEPIIPTSYLKKRLTDIVDESLVTGTSIRDSSLGKVISGLDDFVKVDDMNSIRTALREASYDPSLLGSSDKALLQSLKSSVDDSIINAETYFLETSSNLSSAVQRTAGDKGMTRYYTGKLKDNAALKSGFEALRAANDFYKEGINKFDTLYAKQLGSSARNSGKLADPEAILDEVVVANRPKLLKDLLDSTRPPPLARFPIQEAPESFLDIVPNVSITGKDGRVVNLRQTIAENPNDDLSKFYQTRFQSQKEFSEEVAAARTAGKNYPEAIRGSLARRWMERTVNGPDVTNIFGRTDPLKVASKIRALEKTAPVLFGKQYEPIMKSLSELSLLGEEIGQNELRMLAGRPITEQIQAVAGLTKQAKELKGLPFLRSLEMAAESGEVDKVVALVTRNKDTISQAQKFLGKDSVLMESVKDEVLAKTIGSLGDPSSTIVSKRGLFGGRTQQRTVSPEFVKDVMSGKQHDKIMKALDSMGREKMEMLFGKDFIDRMANLAKKSESVSMRSIKGLGGLEVASIARALTMGAMFVAPISVLTTIGGIKAMGTVLRSPFYLKMVSRPTGDLDNALNLERALGVAWGATTRTLGRPVGEGVEDLLDGTAANAVVNAAGPVVNAAGPIVQDFRQQAAPVIAGAQQAGADALRQIEENKLMGIGANQ
jgi:hypothetical protein